MNLNFKKYTIIPVIFLIAFSFSFAIDYKCYTKDGKTWDCSLPIESFFDSVKEDISKVSTTDDSQTGTSMSVFGTEYFIGEDNATTFLQLLNSTNDPVTNSSCFVTIWNPDKSVFITNASMTYLSDGIYYRDYNLPQSEGIYMISAKCSLPKLVESKQYIYNYAYDDFESGVSGGIGWNDQWLIDAGSHIQNTEYYSGNYALECEENAFAMRSFDYTNGINITVSFFAKFYSIDLNEKAYFSVYDGTEHLIDTWEDGDDDDTWRQYNYTITGINPTCNLQVIFRTDFNSIGDKAYFDELNISIWKYNYTEAIGFEYQEVRGSGEVHVIDPVSTIINGSIFQNDLEYLKIINTEMFSEITGINSDYRCLDNMTSQHYENTTVTVDGNEYPVFKHEEISCISGCDYETGKCINTRRNWIITLIVILAVLGIIIFGYWINERK